MNIFDEQELMQQTNDVNFHSSMLECGSLIGSCNGRMTIFNQSVRYFSIA